MKTKTCVSWNLIQLCFYLLNNYQPILSKKSTQTGITDRRKIIASHSIKYLEVIAEIVAATKRNGVKIDDILDATVMAIRASSCRLKQVPADSYYDSDTIVY